MMGLGRYQLVRRLARGGMADIYLAYPAPRASRRDTEPDGPPQPVALKVLSKARAADPEACAMFLDEARLVALLQHDNIAAAIEVDVADGHHYLAMEYVDGTDLRAVLTAAERAGLPLPLDAAISIVCGAAAGLDHAHHRRGPDGAPLAVVHCDVSLSNVMVGHAGAVKVVDFGIATTAIASVRTSPGMVRGKASYMSPEQCLGEALDLRADVFALGVVLYELTTGTRCFHGTTDFDCMLAVVRGGYTPPCDLIASYPRDLERVVRTALAASPARRFASAAAMRDALAEVAAAHGWTLGAGAIAPMMRALFGPSIEPRCHSTALPTGSMPQLSTTPATSQHDDGPATERATTVPEALATAEPTRPARHLVTRSDSSDDDLDERTRGRGPLRRPHAQLAAQM